MKLDITEKPGKQKWWLRKINLKLLFTQLLCDCLPLINTRFEQAVAEALALTDKAVYPMRPHEDVPLSLTSYRAKSRTRMLVMQHLTQFMISDNSKAFVMCEVQKHSYASLSVGCTAQTNDIKIY